MANDQHFGNPEYTRAFMESMAKELAHRVELTPLHNYEMLWILARATQIIMEIPKIHCTPTSINE